MGVSEGQASGAAQHPPHGGQQPTPAQHPYAQYPYPAPQQLGHYPGVPSNLTQSQASAAAVIAPGGYQVHSPGAPAHPSTQSYGPHSTVCIGQPVHDGYAVAPGALEVCQPQAQQQEDKECCRCSIGWVLYGLGWVFPLCWVIAIILPFFTKDRGDKRAAIASGITLGVLVLIVVVIVVVVIAVTVKQ